MAIRPLSDSDLRRAFGLKVAWIGAASFEERSTASLARLERLDIRPSQIVVLDYGTSIKPEGSGEAERVENLRAMVALARRLTGREPDITPLEPYSFRAAAALVESVYASGAHQIVVDISCLTNVHAIAIATVLARNEAQRVGARLVYTVPENYPGISSSLSPEGWKDIIVAPLSETARFFNEDSGRGIVLVGHEADSLIVGLSEIEPAGGTIVLTWSRRRPDLGDISSRRNLQAIRHLEAMRIADWGRVWLELCDFSKLSNLVAKEVARASKKEAPVILFPYGPKPHVFGMAYELARTYFENSWFVYPIPSSYDALYSQGTGELVWLDVSNGAAAGIALMRPPPVKR